MQIITVLPEQHEPRHRLDRTRGRPVRSQQAPGDQPTHRLQKSNTIDLGVLGIKVFTLTVDELPGYSAVDHLTEDTLTVEKIL